MRRVAPLLALISLLLCAGIATTAIARPVEGPDGAAFFVPPTKKHPLRHGSLLRYRQTDVSLGSGPEQRAWNVVYRSRSARGRRNAVAGTVFVPSAPYAGKGPRPIVTFAVGTQGLDESCAPSRQFEAGSEYENSNIAAALDEGWAVLVTDYEGYLRGQTPTYSAGRSQGHAVLDIVRAARKLPGAGLRRRALVAIWGYSQGGQSAAWAGEQEVRYTPEARVRGVVAGGVPANLKETAENLDGSPGAGLLLAANVGVDRAYPRLVRLDTLLNAAGKAAVEQVKQQCVGETVATFAGRRTSDFTKGGRTLEQLEGRRGIKRVFRLNQLGFRKPSVPVLQYHSSNDEIVPLGQAVDLRNTYCKKGVRERFTTYPGEHVSGSAAGMPAAIDWIGARFAGKRASSNCGTPVIQSPPPPPLLPLPGG